MRQPTADAPETVKDPDTIENLTPPSEAPPAKSKDPDPQPVRNKGGRPRKAAAAPAPVANPGGRPSNRDKLARTLSDQYVMIGALMLPFAPQTGAAVLTSAEQCGTALAAWAETNPRVRRALERMTTGAGAIAVLGAHAPIVLAAVSEVQSVRGGEERPSPLAGLLSTLGMAPEPAAA